MNSISKYNKFEEIKRFNPEIGEFWYARSLATVLEYKDWRNFINVINKAKEACLNSKHNILDHFVDVTEMVELGSGAKRQIEDILLSRYACYLIIQNADPSKEIIALGQTYFATQTRKQELEEEKDILYNLSENQKRLYLRKEMAEHNKQLVETAKNAGVITNLDYAIFQNHGYQGLYNGMTAKDIHHHKGLLKNQKILDHMGSTELAANLFRATQTEEKLKRENIQGKKNANKTHYEVGKKVRETIKELGGTMPEDLPSVESIKELEKQDTKSIKE